MFTVRKVVHMCIPYKERVGRNTRRPLGLIEGGCRLYCEHRFQHLSKKDYWDGFYKKKGRFEWLVEYPTLKDHLNGVLPNSQFSLLDLGCGSSMLSYHIMNTSKVPIDLTVFDYSQDALRFQQATFTKSLVIQIPHSFSVVKGDVTKLPFSDESFDIILDKGTVDSLLKDPTMGLRKTQQTIKQCVRTLNKSGNLLQITDEDPELRLPLLNESLSGNELISVSFKTMADGNGREYFLYHIQKGSV